MSSKEDIKKICKLGLKLMINKLKIDTIDSFKRNRGLTETKMLAKEANNLIDRIRKEGY